MKYKVYIYIFVFATFILSNLSAQEVSQNNFYQQNPFSINPAAAGIKGNLTAFANYRDQWTGMKGAPETASFSLHGLLTGNMGLGLKIEQFSSGIFNTFSSDLNYSYRMGIASEQSLAMGLSFGFSQNKIHSADMKVGDATDPILYGSSNFDEALLRAGFGFHYNFKNLNLFVSTPLLYGVQEKVFFQTVFSFLTYDFFINEKVWFIQPSVLHRFTAGEIHQFDVNAFVEWNQKIWLNTSYRTNNSFLAGVGVMIKNVGIGYSFELNKGELSSIAPTSHEIILFFETPFSINKKEPFYKSSRRYNAWN